MGYPASINNSKHRQSRFNAHKLAVESLGQLAAINNSRQASLPFITAAIAISLVSS